MSFLESISWRRSISPRIVEFKLNVLDVSGKILLGLSLAIGLAVVGSSNSSPVIANIGNEEGTSDLRQNRQTQNQANGRESGPNRRWDSRLNNRMRYQTYRNYRNNWSEQKKYLRSNLSRFNQLARLNAQQQRDLDNQMRFAFLSYHNNQWKGSYEWDNYSDPHFLDYLQTSQPSLLQTVLSALGMGVEDGYLYSSNWNSERSQLAENMERIHELAVNGRITHSQERELQNQLDAEFMSYKNNDWNGALGWSQYSEPGFVDHLHNKRPTLLMTVRDYLNM